MKGFRFPDTVVCIGEEAFCHNASAAFKEFVIPDQITALKKYAFARCKNLEKVTIGKNVTKIPDGAFFGSNVSDVVIRGELTEIGISAFEDSKLTEIDIPDSVTEIGDMAFYSCGLKNIIIPKSVIKIGDKAIGYCDDCEEMISGVFITGYRGTAAQCYAKENYVAYREAETGETVRYDLIPVPRETIKKIIAGKRKITLSYKEAEEAAYQVAVKEAGVSSWKRYQASEPSAIIKGLKSGEQYKVKVRVVRQIEGEQYCGCWSRVKKITVR